MLENRATSLCLNTRSLVFPGVRWAAVGCHGQRAGRHQSPAPGADNGRANRVNAATVIGTLVGFVLTQPPPLPTSLSST